MPAPTLYADSARKALRSTFLIHDIDAIDTVADLSTITIGTASATRNIEPRHVGVQGQAPTLHLIGSGGNIDVTATIVVWGVDSRLITVGVPVRFNNVSVGFGNPQRLCVGMAFTEIQGWSFQVLTGSGSLATISAHFGYDLGSDVVLLCDTSSQATRPTLFQSTAFVNPMVPVAAANVTSLKRHTRWSGADKPTATASVPILMVPPRFTVL